MPKEAHSNGENMSDIPFLTSEVARLTGAVSSSNTAILVMMVVAAVAATGLVATQYIAFKRAENLAEVTGRLSAIKERLSAGKIAEASERAGNAQKGAADAVAAQRKVEIELAKQQEKTAEAETALTKLRESLKDRTISPDQEKVWSRLLQEHHLAR